MPQSQAEEEEEGDMVDIVTTTGDRGVVDEGHFNSESAHILIREIREIMGYNSGKHQEKHQ
ncbi:hypothetical protein AB205_0084370 [Aquarana catesbeiana]|uniref:Uncharacterized protein n=1 Tax=Aquarana catesbeiana TaxID=8400 RepID=A0A2G9QAU8_AQUCT|nr:hypothetical protein AB205_0084370 [Aquarana catesbeiana]